MAKDTGSEIVAQHAMPPPAPRPPRPNVTVLEEDDWTEKLEAIIQRDYFPDVPKLENQLEWLRVCIPFAVKESGGLAVMEVMVGDRFMAQWFYWRC
jgi:hypothetical protein